MKAAGKAAGKPAAKAAVKPAATSALLLAMAVAFSASACAHLPASSGSAPSDSASPDSAFRDSASPDPVPLETVPVGPGQAAAVPPDAVPGAASIVDQLIARNLQAKGGRAALTAVRAVRVEGTMADELSSAPFLWRWKAPNELRMEFTYQGETGIQAYDGTTGWKVMPFSGDLRPQEMTDAEARAFAIQADFAGPLLDPGAKGYRVEYVGTARVGSIPTDELKLTRDGEETLVDLDQESGLEIRSVSRQTIDGETFETITTIGDYRPVGDLLLAHSYEIHAKGHPGGRTLTFEQIELDPDLPDELFSMPEPPQDARPAPERPTPESDFDR